jgi:hypothetical protein
LALFAFLAFLAFFARLAFLARLALTPLRQFVHRLVYARRSLQAPAGLGSGSGFSKPWSEFRAPIFFPGDFNPELGTRNPGSQDFTALL